MVQNPHTGEKKNITRPHILGNGNKETSHFSSYLCCIFGVWNILLRSSMAYPMPCDVQLQNALLLHIMDPKQRLNERSGLLSLEIFC